MFIFQNFHNSFLIQYASRRKPASVCHSVRAHTRCTKSEYKEMVRNHLLWSSSTTNSALRFQFWDRCADIWTRIIVYDGSLSLIFPLCVCVCDKVYFPVHLEVEEQQKALWCWVTSWLAHRRAMAKASQHSESSESLSPGDEDGSSGAGFCLAFFIIYLLLLLLFFPWKMQYTFLLGHT